MVRWVGDKRQHTGMQKAGDAMTAAVDKVLANPSSRTRDIGGSMGCAAFGKSVAQAVSLD
jgi:3-isopropylmalate dehydrogenase